MRGPARGRFVNAKGPVISTVFEVSAVKRRLRVVGAVTLLQLAFQALSFLGGLAAVRWMSVEAYAQYSIAFALASTFGMLVDAGFTRSIIALVGERARETEIVAAYVLAARRRRRRLFLWLLAPTIGVSLVVGGKHSPDAAAAAAIAVAVALSVFAQGAFAATAGGLLIERERTAYYGAQLAGAGLRVAGFSILHVLGGLTGVAGAFVNAGSLGASAQRAAQGHRWPEPSSAAVAAAEADMLTFLRPLWPGYIFAALQGQVTVVVIAAVGATQATAQVGALGRLAQVFAIGTAFTVVLIEPFIASTPPDQLKQRYLAIVSGLAVATAGASAVAWAFPGPFLAVLGGKYSGLDVGVGLAVTTGALAFAATVIWTMNAARRWAYGWSTWLYIVSTLSLQAGAAVVFDLRTTNGVLAFGLVSAIGLLAVNTATAVYGFSRPEGRRQTT